MWEEGGLRMLGSQRFLDSNTWPGGAAICWQETSQAAGYDAGQWRASGFADKSDSLHYLLVSRAIRRTCPQAGSFVTSHIRNCEVIVFIAWLWHVDVASEEFWLVYKETLIHEIIVQLKENSIEAIATRHLGACGRLPWLQHLAGT